MLPGLALGMVSQLPEEDVTTLSRRQMMARLDVAMGGRCDDSVTPRGGEEGVTIPSRGGEEGVTIHSRGGEGRKGEV